MFLILEEWGTLEDDNIIPGVIAANHIQPFLHSLTYVGEDKAHTFPHKSQTNELCAGS